MSDLKKEYEKAKIVVVDDADFSRRTIVSILEEEGLNVVGEAENPQVALDVLVNNNANFMIIDIVMPEMSGIQLAKRISENYKDVYIIMISSLNQEHIIIESIASGAMDYLQKPFSKEQLLHSVTKLIKEMDN